MQSHYIPHSQLPESHVTQGDFKLLVAKAGLELLIFTLLSAWNDRHKPAHWALIVLQELSKFQMYEGAGYSKAGMRGWLCHLL